MKRTFILMGFMIVAAVVSQKFKREETAKDIEVSEQSRMFAEFGYASYYADYFEGRTTATGETFHQKKISAAHPTLPFGTTVKVTNIENRQSVKTVINDRGPYVANRAIDLSKAAFNQIGNLKQGIIFVKIEVDKEEIFP